MYLISSSLDYTGEDERVGKITYRCTIDQDFVGLNIHTPYLLAPLAALGGNTWELTTNETGLVVLSGEF